MENRDIVAEDAVGVKRDVLEYPAYGSVGIENSSVGESADAGVERLFFFTMSSAVMS